MTPVIKKLIEDGRWQPIEEAPKDQRPFLVKLPRMMNLVVRSWFDVTNKQWVSDRDTDGGITKVEFYHEGDLFRPLPDNRLADALEVAVEALIAIKARQSGESGAYTNAPTIISDKALAEIQKIAERE